MGGRIVIDASVVLKWFDLADEEGRELARRVYSDIVEGKVKAAAPEFLMVEVVNILIRKKKVSGEMAVAIVRELERSGIEFVGVSVKNLGELVELVNKRGVSAYDGLYLWLAKKKGVLVTADKRLLENDGCVSVEEWVKGK